MMKSSRPTQTHRPLVLRALPLPLALAFVLGGGSIAQAASLQKLLSLDDLIVRSSKVIRADVVAKRSVWVNRMVKTKVRLKVSECLKGDCTDEFVEVETFGGRMGRLTMQVDGASSFNVGEKVVVFLQPLGRTLHTVGMAQGKFVPRFGSDGGLTRDESGIAFVGLGAAPKANAGADDDDEADAGFVDDGDEARAGSGAVGEALTSLTMGRLRQQIRFVALRGTEIRDQGLNSDSTIRDDLVRPRADSPAPGDGGTDDADEEPLNEGGDEGASDLQHGKPSQVDGVQGFERPGLPR